MLNISTPLLFQMLLLAFSNITQHGTTDTENAAFSSQAKNSVSAQTLQLETLGDEAGGYFNRLVSQHMGGVHK